MEKVKDYTVCSEIGSKALCEKVNALINAGWVPYGSISTVSYQIKQGSSVSLAIQFSQAMVKL